MADKPTAAPTTSLDQYPLVCRDTIRFGDTDKYGHVSNAVFASYMETGRAHLLHGGADDLADPDCFFVLARTTIDYLHEINWPGEVVSGSRVATIGRSSVTIEQALLQNGILCATATSIVVQFNSNAKASHPLSARARGRLEAFMQA